MLGDAAIWPSGFALTGVFLTAGALLVVVAGLAFTGVAFAVPEETAPLALLTGVLAVVFLTVLAGFAAAAADAVSAAGFFLTGNGLTVPRGVRAGAGFGVPLPFALTGVAAVFFATGVVPEVTFAGVVVVFGVVDAGAPFASSFFGTFFTGVAAEFAVFVAVVVAFLTGAALVAEVAVFTGVAVAGFFAVD